MIDLEKLNPDWELAQYHAMSTFPGVPDPERNKQNLLLCPCCLNVIHKEAAPLCENSKELEFLGFGFPLYFSFLRHCIMLLLVLIVSYSFMSFYMGIRNNIDFCSDHGHQRRLSSGVEVTCTSFMILFSRIEEDIHLEEVMLRVVSFAAQILTLLYTRDQLMKKLQYFDERTTTLSDYSIMVSNLPQTMNIAFKLRKYLSEGFTSPHQIHQLTLIPSDTIFNVLKTKKLDSITRVKKHMKKAKDNPEGLEKAQLALKKSKEAMQKHISEQLQLGKEDKVVSERAIIIVETEHAKNEILDEFSTHGVDYLLGFFGQETRRKLLIEEAPEPREINWEHINYPDSQRYVRVLLMWILTIVFIFLITVGFYFLLNIKSENLMEALQLDENDPRRESLLNYAVALVFISQIAVIFFNKFIMSHVLHHLTHKENHECTSDEEFSFALKYTLGLFFTTALMTLAVEAIGFHNFYQHPFGVIEEESIMFLFNSFLVPLIWLVNPWHLFRKFQRHLKKGSENLTQAEANQLMENPLYTIGKRYAQIVETVWFTFLYATLIPFGGIVTIFGMIAWYWIDKYNLLRRSNLRGNISGKFNITALALLDFTLVLRPAGELFFDVSIRHSYSMASVVCLGVGLVYMFLPKNRIINLVNQEKFNLQEKRYEKVKHLFKNTYDTQHPILSRRNKERYEKMNSLLCTSKNIKVDFYGINAAEQNTSLDSSQRFQAAEKDDNEVAGEPGTASK